jgi:ABC-type multidrug transport system fused ATPase/permease subunit
LDIFLYFSFVLVAVSLVLLWQLLGPSVLAGVGVMILMVPINGFVMKKMTALQKVLMQTKDKRVKIMNEVLNGIRLIKFFAWERSFIKKINQVREQELKTMIDGAVYRALVLFFFAATPTLVSVVTFSIFVLAGGQLTAEKAFTGIGKFPLSHFLALLISFFSLSFLLA